MLSLTRKSCRDITSILIATSIACFLGGNGLNTLEAHDWTEHIYSSDYPNPDSIGYSEQISCRENECIYLESDSHSQDEILKKTYDLMGQNAGKIVIEILNPTNITSKENEVWKEYIREIAKRDGTVVFEPYYIRTRGDISLGDIPGFGDAIKLGYTIFTRLRTAWLYGRMENYHAKVLYHPTNRNILLYYFVNKSYGDICATVRSDCNTIEYLDDDIFDHQLQTALRSSQGKDIVVHFHNTEATLPEVTLDMDSILSMTRSARMYKWLLASETVEKKNVKKERFITAPAVIKILDYSITAYDYVKAIQMYSHARSWKTVASYEETDKGQVLRTVQFTRATQNEGRFHTKPLPDSNSSYYPSPNANSPKNANQSSHPSPSPKDPVECPLPGGVE